MVLPAIAGIARVVAVASPAAFKVLDGACTALEASAGLGGDVVEQTIENQRARGAIIAFRAACETRKAFKGRRRRS